MVIHPILTLSASLIVAVILFAAASHKLRAPLRFARQLEDYDLLPPAAIATAARAVPLVEVLIAIALLIPAGRAWGGASAVLLLALYTAAIAINLRRGRRDIDCGCSGPGLERPITGALVLRNTVLIALALLAALPMSAAALHGFGLFLIAAVVAAGLILYTAIEGLASNQPRLKSLSGR